MTLVSLFCGWRRSRINASYPGHKDVSTFAKRTQGLGALMGRKERQKSVRAGNNDIINKCFLCFLP